MSKRARPRRTTALAPSYSSPIAILALGVLGGYAALVLLPATGALKLPLWQIALGATLVTLLSAALAVRNCVPLTRTPLRGRLVAALCLVGCIATGVYTHRLHAFESHPHRAPSATHSPDAQGPQPPLLAPLFGRAPTDRSTN